MRGFWSEPEIKTLFQLFSYICSFCRIHLLPCLVFFVLCWFKWDWNFETLINNNKNQNARLIDNVETTDTTPESFHVVNTPHKNGNKR